MYSYYSGQMIKASNTTMINQEITTGLSRVNKLDIFPFINREANGTLKLPPMNSPFTSEPATCSPYTSVINYNVFVSGKPIYEQNQAYSFENFLHEVRPVNSIDGGLSKGLSSGLINFSDWTRGYGMIITNLSRTTEADSFLTRSIRVQLTNNSKWDLDFYCLLLYDRELKINVESGAIVLEA
jgi:hypothetical protein